jgi:hypothetical protein
MYDVGSWVRIAHWDYRDWMGYVVQNNPVTKEHLVRITIGKWGYPIPANKNLELEFHQDYLYPYDITPDLEKKFDLSFLKELALDWSLATWNEELFNETLSKE